MAGYKIQAKKTDGSLVDIPLAATYDDSGKKISEEYATQETVSDIIDGTTKVGKAGEADTATSADHATSADSATSAQSATKATQDSEGNSIIDTYVNKSELGYKCVLYNEAQSLTEEEQARARDNIGAVSASGAGGKNIADANVTLGVTNTYNGQAQEQAITSVVLDDSPLEEGVDYKVAGNIASDAGNYTLAIMGVGDYEGTLWVDWVLNKAQGTISVPTTLDFVGNVGDQKQIEIVLKDGFGDFVVSSSNTDVVTAGVVGNILTMTLAGAGNANITVMLTGNYSATAQFSVATYIPSSTLEDNPWLVVEDISSRKLGKNYWSVGDTHSVPLNGTVGTKSYDNVTVWAYILGFNHNSTLEGDGLIHFGGFKTSQSGGKDIALNDGHYGSYKEDGSKWFNMNHWGGYNYGGWAACDMRYDILGSTNVPPENYGSSRSSGDVGYRPTDECTISPVSGTLMAALPQELRARMKPITKYTDNYGNSSNVSSHVTSTVDYLPLLSEYEIQGARTYANEYEREYQQQYDYYANGNSKVKYRQSSTGSTLVWWARSPYYNRSSLFCNVSTSGSANNLDAYYSYGLAPAFAV